MYLKVIVVVFGAFVITLVFRISDYVRQRVAGFLYYCANISGALVLCFYCCEGCCGFKYLGYLEVYVYWVEVSVIGYFLVVFGCVLTFVSKLG